MMLALDSLPGLEGYYAVVGGVLGSVNIFAVELFALLCQLLIVDPC